MQKDFEKRILPDRDIKSQLAAVKINEMNRWTNDEMEFGLGVRDLAENVDDIKYFYDYALNTFNDAKETEYINENTSRFWFWDNVGFIFSTGLVYASEDVDIMNQIMKYFDKTETSFLPNQYSVLNYNSSIIKRIELENNIPNGNYHMMLTPFVLTTDETILSEASEQAYSRYGPVECFTNVEEIVIYMIEVNRKYSAIRTLMGPRIANLLGVKEEIFQTPKDRYGKYGVPRQIDFNTKKCVKETFFDFETQVTPDSQEYGPTRNWKEGEMTYRLPAHKHYRENVGLGIGAIATNSRKGRKTLYNQLATHESPLKVGIDQMKGAHLKMNDYYDTTSSKHDNPSVDLYDTEPGLQPMDKFVDSMDKRQNVVSMLPAKIRRFRQEP